MGKREWLDSEEYIVKTVHEYYKEINIEEYVTLMKFEGVVKGIVSEEMRFKLGSLLVPSEVTTTVFQLRSIKAPRPNGFNAMFLFQKF